jgi:hypothetical protein
LSDLQGTKQEHRPFEIRKLIVVISIFAAVTTGIISGSVLMASILYSVLALSLDGVIHKVFKFKASLWCEPLLLESNQNISLRDLDIYFESRLTIRTLSVAFASIVTIVLSFFLNDISLVYGMSYIGFTLVSIFYVRLFTTLKRPILVRFYPVEFGSIESNKWQDESRWSSRSDDYPNKKSWHHDTAYSNVPGNIYYHYPII